MTSRKFYARQCELRVLESSQALDFVAVHHRQGVATVATQVRNLGLFSFEGELIAVAQFCAPRTEAMSRKYTTELLRLVFPKSVRVIGGASKLIEGYKKLFSPADIFTYQDATGELTSVYEKAGMSFVSQAKQKEYLVAPGKTLKNASRREAFGIAYVVRYGPDRILGTSLGEVYENEGRRLTNPELFVKVLDWHIETTSGDRVYEWINPNQTHYTYKISSPDSKKYYYGVHTLKTKDASVQDCLADGYIGSGGKKFANWRRRHRDSLQKTVVRVHKRKAEAYAEETMLIGELWRSDSNCLNSMPGGSGNPIRKSSFKLDTCSIHGETKFRGNRCAKCLAKGQVTEVACSIHGITKHMAGVCVDCTRLKTVAKKECPVHGLVSFQGNKCYRCAAAQGVEFNICPIHGKVKFIGNTCGSCRGIKGFVEQVCSVHGKTKHRAGECLKCKVSLSTRELDCQLHGLTTHYGRTCQKCLAAKQTTTALCPIHGETKHRGDTCSTCTNQKKLSIRTCAIHGEVKHNGDVCAKCLAMKSAHKRFHSTKKNESCPLCRTQ